MNKLKNFLLSHPKKNSTQIIDKIRNYDSISFDIFDTLIKRDVYEPADVFSLVETYYNRELSEEKKIHNYRKIRIQAEASAREKSKFEEIIYEEIFNEMKNLDQATIEKLKQIELIIEQEVCLPSRIMKEVYDWCQLKGKKIYLVSDMYLPKNIIESILETNGYKEYQCLLLSSDKRASKKKGKLYDVLLKNTGVLSNQIIHLGDSIPSDIIQCRKKNIHTLYIPRYNFLCERTNKLPNTLAYRCLVAFIENRTNKLCENEYKQFGFECLGPVLFGFTKWLHSSLEENHYDNIFFFSRDGYMMQKAFHLLYPEYHSEYIYVSRKSLRPIIQDEMFQTIETFYHGLGLGFSCTLREIINLFDTYVDLQATYTFYEKQGYQLDEIIVKNRFLRESNYYAFFESFKKRVTDSKEVKQQMITNYLYSLNIPKKIAIIDIGWRANMQAYFEKALKKSKIDVKVTGYFIGLNNESEKIIKENGLEALGYLFDGTMQDRIRPFLGLFETCFLAPMGSTKEYIEDDKGNIKPNFETYEYSGEIEETQIKQIQKGALQFVEEYGQSFLSELLLLSKEDSFFNIEKFGSSPSLKNVAHFGKIRYHDTQLYALATPKSLFYYMIRPKQFIKDFSDSRWKIGFLKKLLKFKLNYAAIYLKLIKRKRTF